MAVKDILAVKVLMCGRFQWVTTDEYELAKCCMGEIIEIKYREKNE